MTVILGIDPGSRCTGYGLIYNHHCRPEYIASGCITITAKENVPALPQLFQKLQAVIQQYQPQEVAIEQVFIHRNPQSALVLGQARGVALLAAELAQLPVYHYAARKIKQMVVGYGAASKSQIQMMAHNLLKLKSLPKPDEADALAIAVCHAHSRQQYFSSAISDLRKQQQ